MKPIWIMSVLSGCFTGPDGGYNTRGTPVGRPVGPLLDEAPPESEESGGCTMICDGTDWAVALSDPVACWVNGPCESDGNVCAAGATVCGGGVLRALVAPGAWDTGAPVCEAGTEAIGTTEPSGRVVEAGFALEIGTTEPFGKVVEAGFAAFDTGTTEPLGRVVEAGAAVIGTISPFDKVAEPTTGAAVTGPVAET